MTFDSRWRNALLAWLHDPPGKSLDVRQHQANARAVIEAALGRPGDDYERTEALSTEWISKAADVFASCAERLPQPTAGPNGERAVGPSDDLCFIHPLSGARIALAAGRLEPDAPVRITTELRKELRRAGVNGDEPEALFLAMWRLLPERLAEENSTWRLLPAETRQPDHTIWHHDDLAAAYQNVKDAEHEKQAFLSLSIGPVQTFISAARTLRDLWSGSLLLSHLAMAAMRPVLDRCGPQVFVFPACRGVPAVDAWLLGRLQQHGGRESDLVTLLSPHGVTDPKKQFRDRLLIPALPNRFVALVPLELAAELKKACEEGVRLEWRSIAASVHSAISKVPACSSMKSWDRVWDRQIDAFWEVRTVVLPRQELEQREWGTLLGEDFLASAKQVLSLGQAIPKSDRRAAPATPTWAAALAVLGKLADAKKELAAFPARTPAGEWAARKCTLLGDFEVVGPAELEASAEYWKKLAEWEGISGFRVREGEQLSAVALVKRFWVATYLAREMKQLGFDAARDTRMPDTATVAARPWLAAHGIDPDAIRREHRDWSGQWVFEEPSAPVGACGPKEEAPDDQRAPEPVMELIRSARRRERVRREASDGGVSSAMLRYYAVLHLDGDHLGRWLRGDNHPRIRDVLHEKSCRYFETLPGTKAHLDATRPLGPAIHAALSEALLRFSVYDVPGIVERHQGELVYAGGDDIVALLPLESALGCAAELREAYSRDFADDMTIRMGHRATASAGLAVLHFHDSLRAGIEAARVAERAAKEQGRDALGLAILRRSGEHATVVVPWHTGGLFATEAAERTADFVHKLDELVAVFRRGATDRWAYKARGSVVSMPGEDAFLLELRRLLERADLSREHKKLLFGCVQTTGAEPVWRFEAGLVHWIVTHWLHDRKCSDERRVAESADLGRLEGACILLQSASFLARGRDDR